MARRLGQPLIHFHPTMQHATTPQQLPLGWNRCQSTYASSAVDAASSAVKTTMAVLQGGDGGGRKCLQKHPWHSDSNEEGFTFSLMLMLINAEKDEEMEGSLIKILSVSPKNPRRCRKNMKFSPQKIRQTIFFPAEQRQSRQILEGFVHFTLTY